MRLSAIEPRPFKPLKIAILTVSDTRNETTDKSGALLVDRLRAAGHTLAAKTIVRDDIYAIRAIVSAWIVDPNVEVAITTGGTESLMTAMLAYRERGRAKGITDPQVIIPVTGHPGMHKGFDYFGIEAVVAPVDDQGAVDVDFVREQQRHGLAAAGLGQVAVRRHDPRHRGEPPGGLDTDAVARTHGAAGDRAGKTAEILVRTVHPLHRQAQRRVAEIDEIFDNTIIPRCAEARDLRNHAIDQMSPEASPPPRKAIGDQRAILRNTGINAPRSGLGGGKHWRRWWRPARAARNRRS